MALKSAVFRECLFVAQPHFYVGTCAHSFKALTARSQMKRSQLGDGTNVLVSAEIDLVFFLEVGIVLCVCIQYENNADITPMV